MKAVREHARFAGQRGVVVGVEAARHEIRADLEQRPSEHFFAG